MTAGYTKITLVSWLTSILTFAYTDGGFRVALGAWGFLIITAVLAYQAGRGDDAWK